MEWVANVDGRRCRVWESGSGPTVGFLAGPLGLSRWTPFMAALARRRHVVAISIPGYPGAKASRLPCSIAEWVDAVVAMLDAVDLIDIDLVGVGVGGTLAAEVAAADPASVPCLVLVAPVALHEAHLQGVTRSGLSVSRLPEFVASDPDRVRECFEPPPGSDRRRWANEFGPPLFTSHRLLDSARAAGLTSCPARTACPTLIVWGLDDRVWATRHRTRWVQRLPGPPGVVLIEDADRLVDLDASERMAEVADRFLAGALQSRE